MMKMTPFSACIVVLLAFTASVAATAASNCDQAQTAATRQQGGLQAPSLAAITACTKIATPEKRLDCYDALTGHSD